MLCNQNCNLYFPHIRHLRVNKKENTVSFNIDSLLLLQLLFSFGTFTCFLFPWLLLFFLLVFLCIFFFELVIRFMGNFLLLAQNFLYNNANESYHKHLKENNVHSH